MHNPQCLNKNLPNLESIFYILHTKQAATSKSRSASFLSVISNILMSNILQKILTDASIRSSEKAEIAAASSVQFDPWGGETL